MTEHNSNQLLNMFTKVCNVLDSEQVNFSKKLEELEIYFEVSYKDLPLKMKINIIPEWEMISFLYILPLKADKNNMLNITRVINDINFSLVFGYFTVSSETGTIAFYVTQGFKDSLISEELIKQSLFSSFLIINELNSRFSDV